MPSPTCTVNSLSTVNGVDVADDLGTVTIQLVDLAADTWALAIVGTDDLVATPALSFNYTTKTATFTKPAGPWAMVFRSQVNNGKSIDGQSDVRLTTTFEIHILVAGTFRLIAANERAEANASFGWIKKVNAALRAIAAATGSDTWQTGTNAAYTLTGTSGTQIAELPAAFTAPRIWTMPTAPTDGMKAGVSDTKTNILVDSGNTLTLTTQGGTDHFWVDGVDKGTSYQVSAALFKGSDCIFRRHAADSTWRLT